MNERDSDCIGTLDESRIRTGTGACPYDAFLSRILVCKNSFEVWNFDVIAYLIDPFQVSSACLGRWLT